MKNPVIDIRNSGMQFETTRELRQKEVLQKRYTSSWVWRSVAAIFDVSPDSRSPLWISKKLNVTVREAVEAIEGLEALGIIERTPNGYKRILKYVYYSDAHLDPMSILSDHVLISSQILSRLHPSDKNQKSFYRTGFVSSNEALVKDFCLKVEALMKEFLEASAREPSDRVVGFSFSNVKVTREESL